MPWKVLNCSGSSEGYGTKLLIGRLVVWLPASPGRHCWALEQSPWLSVPWVVMDDPMLWPQLHWYMRKNCAVMFVTNEWHTHYTHLLTLALQYGEHKLVENCIRCHSTHVLTIVHKTGLTEFHETWPGVEYSPKMFRFLHDNEQNASNPS